MKYSLYYMAYEWFCVGSHLILGAVIPPLGANDWGFIST